MSLDHVCVRAPLYVPCLCFIVVSFMSDGRRRARCPRHTLSSLSAGKIRFRRWLSHRPLPKRLEDGVYVRPLYNKRGIAPTAKWVSVCVLRVVLYATPQDVHALIQRWWRVVLEYWVALVRYPNLCSTFAQPLFNPCSGKHRRHSGNRSRNHFISGVGCDGGVGLDGGHIERLR